MKVILAKTAGFCFGVNRAVEMTYQLLGEGRKVATLGPLIHSPQVVRISISNIKRSERNRF